MTVAKSVDRRWGPLNPHDVLNQVVAGLILAAAVAACALLWRAWSWWALVALAGACLVPIGWLVAHRARKPSRPPEPTRPAHPRAAVKRYGSVDGSTGPRAT